MVILTVLLCIYLALISRASGSDQINAPWGEILFATPFALVMYFYGDASVVESLITLAVVTVGFNLGHTNIYHMGSESDWPVTRLNTIDKIIMPITDRLGWSVRSTKYCWFGMGVKGAIIGLLFFPFTAIVALGWPLMYHISWNVLKRANEPAEYLVSIPATLMIIAWVIFQ